MKESSLVHALVKTSPAPAPAVPLQLRVGAGREQKAQGHAAMPQPMCKALAELEGEAVV